MTTTTDIVYVSVFDPYTETWLDKRFKAKLFEHRVASGSVVLLKLLPVGVLAEALGRTRARIHEWEKEGKLPAPCFAVRGTKTKRWYSENQIKMAQKLMKGVLGSNPLRNNNQTVNHAAFFAAVKKHWKDELNV